MEAKLASLLRRREGEKEGEAAREEEAEEEILTLLQRQPDLQQVEIEDGRNALQLALQYGRELLAGHLLDELERGNGDNIVLVLSHADQCGWTVLHQAASAGRSGIMERLILLGAPLEAGTKTGATALHYAASKGHLGAVELLLRSGARAEALDVKGETPLHRAAAQGHTTIVEALLARAPTLVNVRSREGNTPLHLASESSTRACLRDCGADPAILNEEGQAAEGTG